VNALGSGHTHPHTHTHTHTHTHSHSHCGQKQFQETSCALAKGRRAPGLKITIMHLEMLSN